MKIICAQEGRVHTKDNRNIYLQATFFTSYISPHHFSMVNSLLKVLTLFYLVTENIILFHTGNPVPDALILYELHHSPLQK